MTYPGGKQGSGIYQTIINHIPPHEIYIEPFLGGGAIMRLKAPASCSIGVDIDIEAIGKFPLTYTRAVTLIHGDAISYLSKYPWTGPEFVYCDPPYLLEVRLQKKRLYRHEFSSPEEHKQLLSLLRAIPAAVMISGYWSSLYQDMLPGWSTISFSAVTRSGKKAQEWIWMNYPPPKILHDYRYLGRDFRERERIKRRQHRWKRRLMTMNPLEREALLLAILDPGTPSTEESSGARPPHRIRRSPDQGTPPDPASIDTPGDNLQLDPLAIKIGTGCPANHPENNPHMKK